MQSTKSQYDFIGDIHGHASELRTLLTQLGYCEQRGVYNHPFKKVVFLGDFIDKGPEQRETLEIVIPMVEQGHALAVMGNHEFNALSYHTTHPLQPGRWLREHSDKNNKQHAAFLREFCDRDIESDLSLDDVLSFIWKLPLWIDTPEFRVIHACWSEHDIAIVKPKLNSDNTITMNFLVDANDRCSDAYLSTEVLLKGVEYELPAPLTIFDQSKNPRRNVRVKWWHDRAAKLKDLALSVNAGALSPDVAEHLVPAHALLGYKDYSPPLFLGHYWLEGHPAKLTKNIACLDYSVAKGGHLVAYRWNGESQIIDDNFVVAAPTGCC